MIHVPLNFIHIIHYTHLSLLMILYFCRLYKKMSLEIILAVAFGREIRVQKGDGDQLFKEAKKLMEILTRTPGGHVTALLSIGGPISFYCYTDLLFVMHCVRSSQSL